MRIQNKFNNSEFIHLHNRKWLDNQLIAGKCVSNILKEFKNIIYDKVTNLSLKDIEQMAIKKLEEDNCTPTFLNYHGFPGSVCLSVNNQLVHGIPTDYILQDGDVVTLDLGATYEGSIADAARTYIYGEPKSEKHIRMLDLCEKSLQAGIDAIQLNDRTGVIGYAIHNFVKNSEFELIVNYGGHGIDTNKPHADPFIANRSQLGDGIIIKSGLSIAIEPMLVIGDKTTKILDDEWTVVTSGINCHFEDSVTVMENEKYIVTR